MTDEDERLHELFAPLREQVVKVSVDFGRRVAEGIEQFLRSRESKSPSLLDVFGDLLLESINLATTAAAPPEDREPSEADAGETRATDGDDGTRMRSSRTTQESDDE